MGYSYTAKAGYVMDSIAEQINVKTSNGMPDGGFWEYGREQRDGAIVGTVWKPWWRDLTKVVRRGSFRIDPDGKVKRFPGIPKAMRDKAEVNGAAKYREVFSRPLLVDIALPGMEGPV